MKQCILIPEAKFVKTHNLLVARVLVDNGKSIPARVLNSENSSVRIMKGTVIALLEPVEEVAESSFRSTESVFRVQEKGAETLPEHLQSIFEQGSKDLNPEQTEQFHPMLFRRQKVFAEPNEVGRTNVGTHKIKLTDETPNSIIQAGCHRCRNRETGETRSYRTI